MIDCPDKHCQPEACCPNGSAPIALNHFGSSAAEYLTSQNSELPACQLMPSGETLLKSNRSKFSHATGSEVFQVDETLNLAGSPWGRV